MFQVAGSSIILTLVSPLFQPPLPPSLEKWMPSPYRFRVQCALILGGRARGVPIIALTDARGDRGRQTSQSSLPLITRRGAAPISHNLSHNVIGRKPRVFFKSRSTVTRAHASIR
jgi:hypothetical protein